MHKGVNRYFKRLLINDNDDVFNYFTMMNFLITIDTTKQSKHLLTFPNIIMSFNNDIKYAKNSIKAEFSKLDRIKRKSKDNQDKLIIEAKYPRQSKQMEINLGGILVEEKIILIIIFLWQGS
jgi:hypothetical protein